MKIRREGMPLSAAARRVQRVHMRDSVICASVGGSEFWGFDGVGEEERIWDRSRPRRVAMQMGSSEG